MVGALLGGFSWLTRSWRNGRERGWWDHCQGPYRASLSCPPLTLLCRPTFGLVEGAHGRLLRLLRACAQASTWLWVPLCRFGIDGFPFSAFCPRSWSEGRVWGGWHPSIDVNAIEFRGWTMRSTSPTTAVASGRTGVRDDKRTDAVGEEDSGVVQPSGIEEHVPTSSHRGRGGVGGGAAARGAFITHREAADGLRSSCGRRTARLGRHRREKKNPSFGCDH